MTEALARLYRAGSRCVECGDGALLAALVRAGLDAYGVEPRAAVADAALGRGLEVRIDDGAAHLHAVGAAALGGLVLRGLVERAPLGELLLLVDAAAAKLAPGGRLVVCSLRREAWGRDADRGRGRPRRRAIRCIPTRGTRCSPSRASSTCRCTPRAPTRTSSPRPAPTNDAGMTAVHQFVPTLAPRDAVGRHYLAVQETLRGAGLPLRHLLVRGQGRVQAPGAPVRVVHRSRAREPTWLLYHSSVGSPVADFVAEQYDERRGTRT